MSGQNIKDSGYEKRDVSAVKIILYGILGVIAVVIVIFFIWEVFSATRERLVQKMILEPQSAAIRELRARETEELNSYKLLDAEKGTYQIPIERAIELMADEAFQKKRN